MRKRQTKTDRESATDIETYLCNGGIAVVRWRCGGEGHRGGPQRACKKKREKRQSEKERDRDR